MSGDRNAPILEAFCNNAITDQSIKLQLASIIDYNADNINEEISKAFTLLTKLLGDGRKLMNNSQRPVSLKVDVVKSSVSSKTATDFTQT